LVRRIENDCVVGIDDDVGAGEAGVPRRVRRRERALVEVLVQVEAQPVVLAAVVLVEVGEHRDHRVLGQDAGEAVAATVEHGLGEDRQVMNVGEHSGVTGDATERPGVLVVDLSVHQAAIGHRRRRAADAHRSGRGPERHRGEDRRGLDHPASQR